MTQLDSKTQAELDRVVAQLKKNLGENLHSCVLYGSAVRGGFVPGVSDLNMLIVLQESTPEAHSVIGEIIRGPVAIEPLVMGLAGIERSMQSFLTKFLSIRRNYRVLAGADPLKDIRVNLHVQRFVCEQSVRNLRLRLKYAYIKGGGGESYGKILIDRTAAVFSSLGDVIRCHGQAVPHDFAARISLIESTFKTTADVLNDLLKLKQVPRSLSKDEALEFHARLHNLLNAAISWMEAQWPLLLPATQN